MNAQQEFIIDATTHAEIIHSLAQKLNACYVFPDVAEQIAISLNKHLEDGDYTGISEGELFALALTRHMQEVNHDEHLWVRWHPETLPEDEGPLRLNEDWQEQQQLEARLDNYGIYISWIGYPAMWVISISIISTDLVGEAIRPSPQWTF